MSLTDTSGRCVPQNFSLAVKTRDNSSHNSIESVSCSQTNPADSRADANLKEEKSNYEEKLRDKGRQICRFSHSSPIGFKESNSTRPRISRHCQWSLRSTRLAGADLTHFGQPSSSSFCPSKWLLSQPGSTRLSVESSLRPVPKRYTAKTYKNGDRYEGEACHQTRDGYGLLFGANGNVYVGQWSRDMRHGRGISFSAYGCYEGDHRKNQWDGWGMLVARKQGTYFGQFRHNRRNGRGIMVTPNGSSYAEEWSDGKLQSRIQIGKVIKEFENSLKTETATTKYNNEIATLDLQSEQQLTTAESPVSGISNSCISDIGNDDLGRQPAAAAAAAGLEFIKQRSSKDCLGIILETNENNSAVKCAQVQSEGPAQARTQSLTFLPRHIQKVNDRRKSTQISNNKNLQFDSCASTIETTMCRSESSTEEYLRNFSQRNYLNEQALRTIRFIDVSEDDNRKEKGDSTTAVAIICQKKEEEASTFENFISSKQGSSHRNSAPESPCKSFFPSSRSCPPLSRSGECASEEITEYQLTLQSSPVSQTSAANRSTSPINSADRWQGSIVPIDLATVNNKHKKTTSSPARSNTNQVATSTSSSSPLATLSHESVDEDNSVFSSLMTWSNEAVAVFLNCLGLEHLIETFQRHKILGYGLASLNEEDLENEMLVRDPTQRQLIIQSVKALVRCEVKKSLFSLSWSALLQHLREQFKDCLIDSGALRRYSFIGEGGFGAVYHGLWGGQTEVAIKSFRLSGVCRRGREKRKKNYVSDGQSQEENPPPAAAPSHNCRRQNSESSLLPRVSSASLDKHNDDLSSCSEKRVMETKESNSDETERRRQRLILMLLDLAEEAKVLMTLRHPNVARFWGVSIDDKRQWLITQYVPGGSLFSFIHSSRGDSLQTQLITRICLGVCSAMAYVHSKGLLHCDLKSPNILLDHALEPKICDFGLALHIVDSQLTPSSRSRVGTPQWMAPEVLRGSDFTRAADVYSFGVLLWEMLSRRIPHSQLTINQVVAAVGWGHLRLGLTYRCDPVVERLMRACLDRSPKRRPTFEDLIQEFSVLMENHDLNANKARLFRSVRETIKRTVNSVEGFIFGPPL